MKNLLRTTTLILASVALSGGVAFAGKPQLDTGAAINQTSPYGSAQTISESAFTSHAVYGKLDAASAADIYKFTADKDGEQTLSLVGTKTGDGTNKPLLILIDSTDATEAQSLQLPMPDDTYHSAVIKATEDDKSYFEPALLRHFSFFAEQKVRLAKDKVYYLIVIDPYGQPANYAVKFGEGNAWGAADVIKNLGTIVRLQTASYGGTTPFHFNAVSAAFLLFLVGLLVFSGIFIIESIFTLLANRSKAAGYLLVKLQSFSRIITWVALWFWAVGGFMYFSKNGWVGIPFILIALFAVLLVTQLVRSIRLTPQVAALEVTKREATLPLGLRKRLYIAFVFSILSYLGFVVMLGMYLVS